MPSFSPALIQTMRAALDEVMTKIPMSRNHRTVLGLLAFWALLVVAWAMTGG